MQKSYSRINWENYPSEATPLNESNLNRIDYAINEIDDRVITIDTTKFNISDANGMIKGWQLNSETGVITITYYDNSTTTINTNLNKIAVNFTYDRTTQSLVLTLPDGSTTRVPLSDLIQDNDFQDTSTVAFTVTNGIVTANIRLGSITDEHLRTDYLADIRVAEANASASETSAEASAILSNSWAIGGTQTRQGEASGRRFTVDRWSENIYATTKVVSTGITITSDSSNNNADLGQALDGMYKYLVGKTMTASVMMADGTVYSKSGVIEPNLVGTIRFPLTNGYMCDVNTNSTKSYIGFFIYSTANNPNKTISVRAAKLELGSTSTLIFDTAPNYAEELAKCQRYFERNHWFSWAGAPCVSNGYLQLGCTYPFKVVKRTVPTFTMNPTTAVGIGNGYLLDITTNTYIDKATVTLVQPNAYNYRMLQVKVQHASLVSGHTYAMAIGDNVIDISADIT